MSIMSSWTNFADIEFNLELVFTEIKVQDYLQATGVSTLVTTG